MTDDTALEGMEKMPPLGDTPNPDSEDGELDEPIIEDDEPPDGDFGED